MVFKDNKKIWDRALKKRKKRITGVGYVKYSITNFLDGTVPGKLVILTIPIQDNTYNCANIYSC